MNKVPRFMKEYAAYRMKKISSSTTMSQVAKDELINRINSTIICYKRGLISIDEAMLTILTN